MFVLVHVGILINKELKDNKSISIPEQIYVFFSISFFVKALNLVMDINSSIAKILIMCVTFIQKLGHH